MICKRCKIETQTPFKDGWCMKRPMCEDCVEDTTNHLDRAKVNLTQKQLKALNRLD